MLDLCSRSTQCGTVWPGLVPWRGCPYHPRAPEGSATTPHCDGACGFLKFWSLDLTGKPALVVLLPSWPGQAGRLLALSGAHFDVTGHGEPPAQPSRGVMPLSVVVVEIRAGLTWGWPDPPAAVARASSSSSSSQLQLRLQKILAWITTASRAPAGTHHPWREGWSPGPGRTASRAAGLHPGSPSQS